MVMLGFADSFLLWTGATMIPAFFGLLLIVTAGRVLKPRYLAAFAIGIFLWFFVDTIQGSGTLDVAAGFAGGAGQAGIVGLFVIGVVFFFSLDHNRNIFAPGSAIGKYGMAIPLLVAAALGIHGIGEGASFGGTAALTSSTTLPEAFGGLTGGVAYVLHKALEPMMIGACYCVYSPERTKNATGRLKDLALLSITFAIPSLVGAASGYYLTYDSSYFYALGTGTSLYVAQRLNGALFHPTEPASSKETVTIAVMSMLGLLAIYFAALFHSG
ncbi:hypothetical protein E6H29_05150 [Candidatus Bathyarchaeota archaeon]|nr:MAG: hypothetical protein E6H29_05150 [Candidatus Bathyarchaeota archaeon]